MGVSACVIDGNRLERALKGLFAQAKQHVAACMQHTAKKRNSRFFLVVIAFSPASRALILVCASRDTWHCSDRPPDPVFPANSCERR